MDNKLKAVIVIQPYKFWLQKVPVNSPSSYFIISDYLLK